MHLQSSSRAALLLLSSGLFATLGASTVYREGVSGDLSGSGLTPTVLTVSAGSNVVRGTTGAGSAGMMDMDRDYFTFTVPTGLQFTSLTEVGGTTVGGDASFIGMQLGNQVTVATGATSASGLLGWDHYGPVSVDTDLFPVMSVPTFGSSGFNAPLGPGSYSFWIQEGAIGAFPYAFDFELQPTAVPEPATYGAMLAGIAVLATLFLRRRIFA